MLEGLGQKRKLRRRTKQQTAELRATHAERRSSWFFSVCEFEPYGTYRSWETFRARFFNSKNCRQVLPKIAEKAIQNSWFIQPNFAERFSVCKWLHSRGRCSLGCTMPDI